MQPPISHLYKSSPHGEGLLYAWLSSMHTRVDILLCSSKSEYELLQVVNSIHETLTHLEQLANYYDSSSELASVNRTAYLSPVALSQELYDILSFCLEYNKKTLGCFDVTIHSVPYTQDTIREVELSDSEKTVFFWCKGIKINLSGFLKGYALERIRCILKESLIENALINMGNSSVLALGNHPMGSGWNVTLGTHVVHLQNQCLTTSGNESNERKHIISPQNGKWVEDCRQVGVVTADGAIGEILSTSLFAANQEQREPLMARLDSLLIDFFFL